MKIKLTQKNRVGFILFIVVAVGLLIWALASKKIKIFADTTPQAIHGVIYDRQGKPISGVKVYNSAKSSVFATSNSSGEYNLANLPTGEVNITFEKYGSNFPLSYSDVPSTYWAYREIAAVNNAKVMQGYTSNNTYRPENVLKRSEMAVVLARAIALANGLTDSSGMPLVPAGPSTASFSDVSTTYWAYKEIEYIKSQGVTSGYVENNTFRPDLTVNREQLAVFISRAIKLEPSSSTEQKFSDLSGGSFGYKEIMTLVSEGIISGYPEPDGSWTFRPKTEITRAQTAVFIARAFKNIATTNGGYTSLKENLLFGAGTVAEYNPYLAGAGKYGTVVGQAKDINGAAVSGAKVVLNMGPESIESYTATTDSNGNYKIYNVPEGSIAYFVSKPDSNDLYQVDGWENMVNIIAGKQTEQNLFNLQ